MVHRSSHLLSDPLQRHQDEAEVHCRSRAVAPCSRELRHIPSGEQTTTQDLNERASLERLKLQMMFELLDEIRLKSRRAKRCKSLQVISYKSDCKVCVTVKLTVAQPLVQFETSKLIKQSNLIEVKLMSSSSSFWHQKNWSPVEI